MHLVAQFLVLQQIQHFSTCVFGVLSANEVALFSLKTEVTQLVWTFIQVFELAEEEIGTLLAFKKRYRICTLNK